jgi:hypothetical protein
MHLTIQNKSTLFLWSPVMFPNITRLDLQEISFTTGQDVLVGLSSLSSTLQSLALIECEILQDRRLFRALLLDEPMAKLELET